MHNYNMYESETILPNLATYKYRNECEIINNIYDVVLLSGDARRYTNGVGSTEIYLLLQPKGTLAPFILSHVPSSNADAFLRLTLCLERQLSKKALPLVLRIINLY